MNRVRALGTEPPRASTSLRAERTEPTQVAASPSAEPHEAAARLARDRAFCDEMLPRVSRTFALSIATLPEELRATIGVAYLLCRVVDTIEDDAVVAWPARERLFDEFDRLVADDHRDPSAFEAACVACALGGAGKADHALCAASGAAFRVFRSLPVEPRAAVRPQVLEMSRGMREYGARAAQEGVLRLRDVADLERYGYFVAGTVGKLLTDLFELAVPGLAPHLRSEARARAVSFGVGLQLVNIVKDVAEDLARGDCFLPTELARVHGLALEELLDEARRPAALAVVGAVCARARHHLRRATEYTLLWPATEGLEVRLFCAVPLALALATLHEVEGGDDTLRAGRKPKVSRQVVWNVFRDVRRAAHDDATLRWMLSHYASGLYRDELDGAALDAARRAALERTSTAAAPPRQATRGLAPERPRLPGELTR